MKIMIINCTPIKAWYKDKIGRIYIVEEEVKDAYYVKTKEQGGNFGVVSKKDAKIV